MMKARPSKVPWEKGERVVWRGRRRRGHWQQIVGSFVDLGFVLLGNWERRVSPREKEP
jgi:hypothetical protein